MTKRFGATHAQDKSCGTWFSFVKAFTLAEVLITLGIIGVVAAITIPTLVKNYQKTVWVNQLKKSVSTLEQGFQKMLADDGVDDLHNTELGQLFANTSDDGGYYSDQEEDVMQKANNIFIKYFNTTRFDFNYSNTNQFWCKEHSLLYDKNDKDCVNGDYASIYLSDGAIIGFASFLSRYDYRNSGCIEIDINGEKKPNTWGRDTFAFSVSNNGHLIPRDYENCNLTENGYSCAAHIIKNGWKMDY